MKISSSELGTGVFAIVLGYVLVELYGDLWIAGALVVTSSISLYVFLLYPRYQHIYANSKSKFWYGLTGSLTPVFMILLPNSELISGELPVAVLLGLLWLGGAYAGIATAHSSREDTSNEE